MADFDDSWVKSNNDTSFMSNNIKKHIKHGHHRTKYSFEINDPTDKIDSNIKEYSNTDHIKNLHAYMEEHNLGEIEFSVFQCKSKRKTPAYYANIKHGNTSLASSFPEKYSLPEIAQQVAARNALAVLKKNQSLKNIPVTQDMVVVAERLEKELKKNFAGLFGDKVENIYKEVYNESLPSNWLDLLGSFTKNIMIENLSNQNKSILYYVSNADREKIDESKNTALAEFPIMKFVDKTEKSATVSIVDSNHMFWIHIIRDTINDDYDTLFKLMNLPEESEHYVKMFNVELFDVYAVQADNTWYRFQVIKIEDDNITGIFIDLGIECIVTKNDVMYLPEKYLNVPSQAVKCSLTSLFFAPYFQAANNLFHSMLFGREFTVVPDNIDGDIPEVTLYNGKSNVNSVLLEAIVKKTNVNQIDGTWKKSVCTYIDDGYLYILPPTETLLILESILESVSLTRPLNELYSKKSVSPNKVYLVQCPEQNIWCRVIIKDFVFTDHKFKVFFIDYGNSGFIDQDKFIDIESIDLLLALISPQALKVSFHLFPPHKLTPGRSQALFEMIANKYLDIEVVSTNSEGVQVVEIYEHGDQNVNRISFNTQLYQSV